MKILFVVVLFLNVITLINVPYLYAASYLILLLFIYRNKISYELKTVISVLSGAIRELVTKIKLVTGSIL